MQARRWEKGRTVDKTDQNSLYKSYENPLFCELITIFKKREELLIDGTVGTSVCHDLRLILRTTLKAGEDQFYKVAFWPSHAHEHAHTYTDTHAHTSRCRLTHKHTLAGAHIHNKRKKSLTTTKGVWPRTPAWMAVLHTEDSSYKMKISVRGRSQGPQKQRSCCH